jgi:putative ABC transport system permease protein
MDGTKREPLFQEHGREAMMDTLLQDIGFGFRMLLKARGVTALAVLTLALGVGANTVIFSVVNAVLLRPLPYKEADRLVMLWATQEQLQAALDRIPISAGDFIEWRDQNHAFEEIAAVDSATFNLTGMDQPEQIVGARVSANFFQLMGIQPALGRSFLPDEERQGNNQVVIISHSLWQRRFGANPQVVGQTMTLNNKSYNIIGIMPPNFTFPRAADLPSYFEFPPQAQLWSPLALSAQRINNRRSRDLAVIARLKPGVSIDQAQTEMSQIASRMEGQYPENKGWNVSLLPLRKQVVGDVELALLVLVGAVSFVLLIACANVANLLLARSATRAKEIAVRMAMGATPRRIVRQLLTESLLLALVGGALGVLLAYIGLPLLLALVPSNIPRVEEIGINLWVLCFTLAISLITGIIFGMAPALQLSKINLNEVLKEGVRGSTGGGRSQRLRNLLVVAEVALALVLLVGAGLMIRSFMRLLEVAPGFNAENVMTMEVMLSSSAYSEKRQQADFFRQVLERIASLPGVRSAAAVSYLPLKGEAGFDNFTIEGRPAPPPGQEPILSIRIASPGYFNAMNIPVLKGRALAETDTANSPLVIVINESMARKFWPNEDPIGKRIKVGGSEVRHGWEGTLFPIVGVAGDVRSLLDAEPKPQIYFSYLQMPWPAMTLAIRTASAPQTIATAVREQIWAINKDQPVINVKTMEEYLSESVAQRRFSMLMLSIFAVVALILAAVGIYGVMSYSVTQRTNEIGIRMALGAQKSDILKLILKQGMVMVLIGVGIGLAVAVALTRIISSLLYGVGAIDLITYAFVASLLIVVALLAILLPSLKATKVDPMTALRAT